jgi:hypothetical protein
MEDALAFDQLLVRHNQEIKGIENRMSSGMKEPGLLIDYINVV